MGCQDPPNLSSARSALEFWFQMLPRCHVSQRNRQSHHLPFSWNFLRKSPVRLAPLYLKIDPWKCLWHQIFIGSIDLQEFYTIVWMNSLVFSLRVNFGTWEEKLVIKRKSMWKGSMLVTVSSSELAWRKCSSCKRAGESPLLRTVMGRFWPCFVKVIQSLHRLWILWSAPTARTNSALF